MSPFYGHPAYIIILYGLDYVLKYKHFSELIICKIKKSKGNGTHTNIVHLYFGGFILASEDTYLKSANFHYIDIVDLITRGQVYLFL